MTLATMLNNYAKSNVRRDREWDIEEGAWPLIEWFQFFSDCEAHEMEKAANAKRLS